MFRFGRAPAGGFLDEINQREYKGGEFLPFYVPRPIMPQLNEEDYTDFLLFLADFPVDVDRNFFYPTDLRPHQRIDKIKASLMTDEIRAKPIWVSKDLYVLDGNHRWMAHAMEGAQVDAFIIQQPFEQAIETMLMFPRTFHTETQFA